MSVSNSAFSSEARLPISLEFFPPKTAEGVDKLAAVRRQLLTWFGQG